MSQRTLLFLLAVVLVGIGTLLVLNLSKLFIDQAPEKYIRMGTIRGVAIEHEGKLFTLNDKQQTEAINILNMAVPVKATAASGGDVHVGFDRIVIYRFQEPNIEIIPMAYVKDNLVFSCHTWNPEGLLKELSRGRLKALIANSYDKS